MRMRAALLAGTALVAAPLSAQSAAVRYGPWQYVMGHPGIKYALRCDNCASPGQHTWWVRFENDLNERVAFSFRVDVTGRTNVHFSDRLIIEPGKAQEGWNPVDDQGATPMVYTAMWKSGPDAS
jgi:hypothetical protein